MNVSACTINRDTSPPWLIAELRSDHAGELGAVMIYRGILAVSASASVRAFAAEHLTTEQNHLGLIETILPSSERSRLQWPWRMAGWLIGAIPALISDQWVYATIEAVETFVDEHYQLQLDRLNSELPHHPVRAILAQCQADEIAHKHDAATRLEAASSGAQSKALGLWRQSVDLGSRGAVVIARAF